ncbi:acyl-ACP--UDP-N-acetylglucosamine O-acyltransferase [Sediminicurvatus halobius]|uniref:Acyl-[acyl-carrier-protein]--UDP-N-acetylglucosamine O-acyltransferase n=1 Tax=Sediminicurvatus halobius TaxID=2182432 RepID=A0A2U2N409_9GAMM|nr:acyl-ACP--UDP-N-acetylglucosamine O-acyltransferase [Spiribacter halobius]PWG63916.1 acyl-[acyl-carrier-protein]--UDP-N-acetylglucosamine O-acyltransferase [Spiribacter halobius]UEX76329.1 acyl-ACP--UDP-N-acetylglucosamine O-acyltransferase [Spiribacter halobius]
MSGIDPRAVIDPDARLAADVEIGPYAIIGPGVELGPGCQVGPHAVVRGPSRIGARTRIFQFASVGEIPQDKKFAGEESVLEVGEDNTIREFVTINRGTGEGGGRTRIGAGNWIMAYVHIAHDCQVGDGIVFANGASLAGHVEVADHAILGGFTLVHQFCRLGRGCFASMGSCIRQDVPPYVTVAGDPALPHGLNSEGLRRRGCTAQQMRALRRAYRALYKRGLRLHQAIDEIAAAADSEPMLEPLVTFLRESRRGIVR